MKTQKDRPSFADTVRTYIEKNIVPNESRAYHFVIRPVVDGVVLVVDSMFDSELFFNPCRFRLEPPGFQDELLERKLLRKHGVDLIKVDALEDPSASPSKIVAKHLRPI